MVGVRSEVSDRNKQEGRANMQIKGRGSHTLTVSRQPDFTMIYVAIVRTLIMTIAPCMSNNAELSQYFNPRNFAFRMTSHINRL